MQLKRIGDTNATEVILPSGLAVLYSYSTPVAVRTVIGNYIKTEKKWSKTTSKQINQWLDGVQAETLSQEALEKFIKSEGGEAKLNS